MNSYAKARKVNSEAPTIAGTSEITSATYDMANYESIECIVRLGTAAADNGVQARQGQQSNMSDGADLEGSKVLSDGTQKTIRLEIIKPRERYVDFQVQRGTSTTIDSFVVIRSGARTIPVDNSSDTDVVLESHVSPAEGTA